jgi:hypothetical protein
LSDVALQARDLTWKKYLVCDPRPDATSLIDVNTFLSLLKEERVRHTPPTHRRRQSRIARGVLREGAGRSREDCEGGVDGRDH